MSKLLRVHFSVRIRSKSWNKTHTLITVRSGDFHVSMRIPFLLFVHFSWFVSLSFTHVAIGLATCTGDVVLFCFLLGDYVHLFERSIWLGRSEDWHVDGSWCGHIGSTLGTVEIVR